jgi:hypothetical protein
MGVGAALLASGVLLQIFGPDWAKDLQSHGRSARSLSVTLSLSGLILIVIGIPEVMRRMVKGPQPSGRHSSGE